MKNHKGIFCVSLDTELMWGRQSIKNAEAFILRTKKERAIIKKILSLLNQYRIPATWAIVGNLFLRPNKQNKNPDLWHARDIVHLIKNSKQQEIACHSLSHPDFNKLNQKAAENELQKCIMVGEKDGIKFDSFVFPENKVNHLRLLKKYGFRAFRGPDPYFSNLKPALKKLVELIDFLLLIPHATRPSKTTGLINIPGTMYFLSGRGLRKYLPQNLRYLKARQGINKAIKEGKLFHLWTHPTDFADDSDKLFSDFEKILRYTALKKASKELEVKTMKDIAKTYQSI